MYPPHGGATEEDEGICEGKMRYEVMKPEIKVNMTMDVYGPMQISVRMAYGLTTAQLNREVRTPFGYVRACEELYREVKAILVGWNLAGDALAEALVRLAEVGIGSVEEVCDAKVG